jgi:hypothetical protein
MTRDSRRRTLITGAVWAIAGVLAVISPFLNFYSDGFGFSTTGFGRVRGTVGSNGVFYGGGPSGEHDLRLGIALCVAAALLGVVGAVLGARDVLLAD